MAAACPLRLAVVALVVVEAAAVPAAVSPVAETFGLVAVACDRLVLALVQRPTRRIRPDRFCGTGSARVDLGNNVFFDRFNGRISVEPEYCGALWRKKERERG